MEAPNEIWALGRDVWFTNVRDGIKYLRADIAEQQLKAKSKPVCETCGVVVKADHVCEARDIARCIPSKPPGHICGEDTDVCPACQLEVKARVTGHYPDCAFQQSQGEDQCDCEFGRPEANENEECYNCQFWDKPRCGWGYGNCTHIKGKGTTKKSDHCDHYQPKVEPQQAEPGKRVDMNEEFIKYMDLIATMCVDCIGGGITQQTYLSNLKLMIPKMSELLADPELGPYEVECGFPKRKHGMKLQEKHLCSKCKWQTCCELPRPPRVYKCSDFEPQPEQFKVEPGEVDKMLDSIEAEPYPPEKFNRMLNKIKDGIATETIDKIFLELSQITSATTMRDLSLQARIEELEAGLDKAKGN